MSSVVDRPPLEKRAGPANAESKGCRPGWLIPSPHLSSGHFNAQCATTSVAALTHRCANPMRGRGAGSVSLKNGSVDPSRLCISAPHGVGDAARPQGSWQGISVEIESRAPGGSVLGSRYPTCMGPPLTDSPGWCQVFKPKRAGSLSRQAQPRAA